VIATQIQVNAVRGPAALLQQLELRVEEAALVFEDERGPQLGDANESGHGALEEEGP